MATIDRDYDRLARDLQVMDLMANSAPPSPEQRSITADHPEFQGLGSVAFALVYQQWRPGVVVKTTPTKVQVELLTRNAIDTAKSQSSRVSRQELIDGITAWRVYHQIMNSEGKYAEDRKQRVADREYGIWWRRTELARRLPTEQQYLAFAEPARPERPRTQVFQLID